MTGITNDDKFNLVPDYRVQGVVGGGSFFNLHTINNEENILSSDL
jgi:hypothetical protein